MSAAPVSSASSALRLAAGQVRYEQLAFWRNRRAALFTFAFPIILLTLFSALAGGDATVDGRPDLRLIAYYVPAMLSYSVLMGCLMQMAIGVVTRREAGILKRVQGTPLPWGSYVAGWLGSMLLVVTASTVLVLAIGAIAFGVDPRLSTLPGLILSLLLGVAYFASLGIGLTRWVPNSSSGPAVLNVLVVPIAVISGVFSPVTGISSWVSTVADVFPLKPLADALQTAFDPRTHGAGLVGSDLLHLAIWTVVGVGLALRVMAAERARG